MGGTPCSVIPEFVGTQTLDGLGTEFCSYPGVELDFSNASKIVEYNGYYGSKSYKERAIARFTWNPHRIRAFIRVYDKEIVPATSIDSIWNADGVEVMITANAKVTGSTADDPAAIHVLISPGAGNSKGLAAIAKTTGTEGKHTALGPLQFATTQDAEGYSVELSLNIPPGITLTSGAQVYFDFALNAADANTGTNPRDAQAIFYLGVPPSPSPCGTDILPYCDDRAWCRTTLE
jgi:hypothetical protein